MGEADNKKMLVLFGIIVAALMVILISILGLEVPAIPACVIVVLEAALALCLNNIPIWQHGVVVIAQIIAGALTTNTIFMVLCVVLYVLGIFSLRFFRK